MGLVGDFGSAVGDILKSVRACLAVLVGLRIVGGFDYLLGLKFSLVVRRVGGLVASYSLRADFRSTTATKSFLEMWVQRCPNQNPTGILFYASIV